MPDTRRCRRCGCNTDERCSLEVRQPAAGRPATNPARRYDQTITSAECRLHDAPGGPLCTRCVSPDRMTTAQLGEVDRILTRKAIPRHEVSIVYGQHRGTLILYAGPAICVELRP